MGTVDKVKEYVGKSAWIRLGGLSIKVAILDYKSSYGKDRFYVEPISGKGQIWIEQVEVIEE